MIALFEASARHCRRSNGSTAVRFAFDQLKAVHARVLGCVLNDVDSRRDSYYGSELAGKYYEAHS